MSKLKKDVNPVDISDIKIEGRNYHGKFTQEIKDTFKYVLALINRLPYKEELESAKWNDEAVYSNDLMDLLRPYVRGGRIGYKYNLRAELGINIYNKVELKIHTHGFNPNQCKVINITFEKI